MKLTSWFFSIAACVFSVASGGSDVWAREIHVAKTGSDSATGSQTRPYITINKAEILHVAAAFLVPGLDGEPMARVLEEARKMGVTTSLDTAWDAEGCYARTAGEEFITPAFKVEKVVDTLGAGDSFAAGFLTATVAGWDLRKA